MISQQNKSIGIIEWKGPQEDAFDEREDRSGGADAEGQGEDDGQGKAWRFAQLAKREAEILRESVQGSSQTSRNREQPGG
jgi:hypothetical protein